MDPNENIRQQIELWRRTHLGPFDVDRLNELINAYWDWRNGGGFAASDELLAELFDITERPLQTI